MSTATVAHTMRMTLDGKRYIVVPEEEYFAALDAANTIAPEDMTEEDKEDLRQSELAKKEPAVPIEQVMKEYGIHP
jgi:hypothetical protein